MNQSKHQFTLINSTYRAEEAREVLTSLINDKIQFLNIQAHSLNERYGLSTVHLENRIKELEQERKRIIDMLRSVDNKDAMIEISSQVNLTVKHTVDADPK